MARIIDSKLDWFQQGLYEYMLLANPSEEVDEKVRLEKEHFQYKYGAEIATRTLPHITIANFLAKGQMENLICSWTQNACNLQYSFTVALNNFSGFPAHAIFIRVQNPKPFRVFANNLNSIDQLLQTNDCPPLQLVTKPHMTIARRLEKDVYEKAIVDYAQRSFYDTYTLDKLTLLKRDSRYKKWQHVTHFHLPPERNLFN
ncbi:MAG: 2-5 ligase family protein [Flaviaesturariibacter sp.]|nr:2-5 ligase family protein [Flaviaesturariibacter sp.]